MFGCRFRRICWLDTSAQRFNGRSTAGLDYAAVLDMVIAAERPVSIYFARKMNAAGREGARVHHQEWPKRAAMP